MSPAMSPDDLAKLTAWCLEREPLRTELTWGMVMEALDHGDDEINFLAEQWMEQHA